MTHDEWKDRASDIDREVKDIIQKLTTRTEEQKKEDEQWADDLYGRWLKKHTALVQDMKDRRVALEDLLRESFGPFANYEVEEAPTLASAGRIPDTWRPKP